MTATVDSLLLDIAIMRVRIAAGVHMADADFVESEHPRRDDGEFTEGVDVKGSPADHFASEKYGEALKNGLPTGIKADVDATVKEISIRSKVSLKNSAGHPVGIFDHTYRKKKNEISIAAAYIEDDAQGQGLVSKLTENVINEARRIGVSRIVTQATGVGGYAWAKLGFVPVQADWDDIRMGTLKKAAEKLSAERKAAVDRILDDKSPTAMMRLIRLPEAKAILVNSQWDGVFDLTSKP